MHQLLVGSQHQRSDINQLHVEVVGHVLELANIPTNGESVLQDRARAKDVVPPLRNTQIELFLVVSLCGVQLALRQVVPQLLLMLERGVAV